MVRDLNIQYLTEQVDTEATKTTFVKTEHNITNLTKLTFPHYSTEQ